MLNRLIRYQEISKGFINDKNKLFTSNYWRTLLSMLRIKLKISTTFHSQTNEQTKRVNQSLKQYLRHYINNTQSNWVKLLLMTQLTLNAKVSNTTKTTPFFANFEKESKRIDQVLRSLKSKKSVNKSIHDRTIVEDLKFAKLVQLFKEMFNFSLRLLIDLLKNSLVSK